MKIIVDGPGSMRVFTNDDQPTHFTIEVYALKPGDELVYAISPNVRANAFHTPNEALQDLESMFPYIDMSQSQVPPWWSDWDPQSKRFRSRLR